jgi:signal transduction histidine kinase
MRKPFLTYLSICAVPLLLLAALNYWNATRSVDNTVRAVVQDDLHSFTATVDRLLEDQGKALLKLAVTSDLQRAVADASAQDSFKGTLKPVMDLGYFKSLAIYNTNHQPFRLDSSTSQPVPDDRVWSTQGNVLIERMIDDGSSHAALELSVPVHNENGLGNEGAVVGIVDLQRVFSTAARASETSSRRATAPLISITDRGETIYHSESAAQIFDVTAFSPLPRLHVTASVSRSRAAFISAARWWGVVGFMLALVLASIAAVVLDRHVRARSRGITRFEEDLSAIAKGDIDRQIVLQSSDDGRAVADNINAMTAQLRAQIAREEESRQFESFVRLSAMLTHDLKNAIEGLSLTVNNMERHFNNEQFRIDALKGLTNATDKLKAIVARLSRPVNTLSGEHKRPTETDLVPILKRVVAMTAEPVRGKHTIQTKLPPNLYALADATRVEEVIENLILNALEAMGDKSGTLTVEAAPDANGAPSFSVSDTGPGMSPTFIETRLFRPFSTTKKNGIGLGLYTCREVIRASGGSIDVQSVEGAGTTFRVVLPSIPHDRRN